MASTQQPERYVEATTEAAAEPGKSSECKQEIVSSTEVFSLPGW